MAALISFSMATVFIPHIQVRNNCLVLFDQPSPPYNHRRNIEGFKKAYSGKVAAGTEKRIRKAIDIFLQTTPTRRIWNPVIEIFHDFRLGFLTLTIAETRRNIDAKEGHQKLLRPFLDWAKTKGVKNYIWKAELQERGQLHYHLTIDEFIHYMDIQKKWNYLQKAAGLLDDYARRNGHFNPNSTDIHSVRNVQNFDVYLAKYIAKASQNQAKLNGKVWDCSQGLKKPRFTDELDSETEWRIRDAIESKKAEKVATDRCTIVKFPEPIKILSSPLQAGYNQWK